jgi:hypothetical protein
VTFEHAYATRGCTQEDAPALEIYLINTALGKAKEPPRPYIRFELSSSATEPIPQGSFELSGLSRDPKKMGRIVRGELAEPGRNSVWLSGSLTIEISETGKQVRGQYQVKAPDGRSWKDTFVAEYSYRQTFCG